MPLRSQDPVLRKRSPVMRSVAEWKASLLLQSFQSSPCGSWHWKDSLDVVRCGVSQGSQDSGAVTGTLWGAKAFVCGEQQCRALEGAALQLQESWCKGRVFRKGKEKTNHACTACVHFHACAYASGSVGVINSSFLGAFGKQSVKLQNTPSSLCKHYINLERGKKRDLKHCKRLYWGWIPCKILVLNQTCFG